MPQFVYTLLQCVFGIITIVILMAIYHVATKKLNIKSIKAALVIMLPYIIIGLLTYNVEKKRIGAICCDDWRSESKGSGACSFHGGVREWRVRYQYNDYVEPLNTLHKVLYFWYAMNENHIELETVSNCDVDIDY